MARWKVILSAVLLVVVHGACPNLTFTTALDWTYTTRVPEYPNGAVGLNLSACFALCCSVSECQLLAWLNGTSTTCWPLSAASGLGPSSHGPEHIIGYTPTPTPFPVPSSWAAAVAVGDMLYTDTDAFVPSDLHPMIGK